VLVDIAQQGKCSGRQGAGHNHQHHIRDPSAASAS
jgi:hypothetical protein